MLVKVGIGTLCATLLAASPAFAVTITNQDSHPHTIIVDRGAKETQQQIDAGKSVQVNCPDKCGFYDHTFEFSRLAGGNDKLVVDKDGELHFAGGHGDVLMPDGTT